MKHLELLGKSFFLELKYSTIFLLFLKTYFNY